jgi:hypothetical protein
MFYTENNPLLYFPEEAGKSLHFYCTDNEENYKKHNKQGWQYYNTAKQLEYNFNSLGYRTKELSSLDSDYILVFGCSYTEGVGLYEHEIWCNKIAQLHDLNVINLAKAGTGPDVIALNTQLFIKNKFKLPKCVVVQWPNSTRKSFAYIEPEGLRLEDRNVNNWVPGTNSDSDWYFNRWLIEEGQMHYENLYHLHSVNNIWNTLGIPIHNWSFGDFQIPYDKSIMQNVTLHTTDRARDMAHDGPGVHDQVVEQIGDKIKCLISH